MNAMTIGVDLAKNVFVVCVADGAGRAIEMREFNRAGFLAWLPTLAPGTVVAMEACGGAHCWGRTMQALGLEPRLMVAEFVRPYRKRQAVKNDRADAAAIVAALHAPGMRFIPVKTETQQQRLAWHSLRLGWIEERTALLNRIRGLLVEFGVVIETGATRLRRWLPSMSAMLLNRCRSVFWCRRYANSLWRSISASPSVIGRSARSRPKMQQRVAHAICPVLVCSPPMRSPPAWAMRGCFRTVASSPPGWD